MKITIFFSTILFFSKEKKNPYIRTQVEAGFCEVKLGPKWKKKIGLNEYSTNWDLNKNLNPSLFPPMLLLSELSPSPSSSPSSQHRLFMNQRIIRAAVIRWNNNLKVMEVIEGIFSDNHSKKKTFLQFFLHFFCLSSKRFCRIESNWRPYTTMELVASFEAFSLKLLYLYFVGIYDVGFIDYLRVVLFYVEHNPSLEQVKYWNFYLYLISIYFLCFNL